MFEKYLESHYDILWSKRLKNLRLALPHNSIKKLDRINIDVHIFLLCRSLANSFRVWKIITTGWSSRLCRQWSRCCRICLTVCQTLHHSRLKLLPAICQQATSRRKLLQLCWMALWIALVSEFATGRTIMYQKKMLIVEEAFTFFKGSTWIYMRSSNWYLVANEDLILNRALCQ